MKKTILILLILLAKFSNGQFIPVNYLTNFPSNDTPGFYNIYPWHQDSAWLYVTNNSGVNTNTKLYKTSNQGANWQFTGISAAQKGFIFYSQNGQKAVIAYGEGKVAITDNGGQNWDSIFSISKNYFGYDGGHCLFRKDDTVVIYKSFDSIQITTNRGANLQTIILPFRTTRDFFYFLSPTVFYAYNIDDSSLYKTTNSGNAWNKLWTYPIIDKYPSNFWNDNFGKKISVPKEGLIFLMTANRIFRIENDGQSSAMIKQHLKRSTASFSSGIHFLNRDTGFACNYNYMLRTMNGGNSWEYFLLLPSLTEFHSVRFAPGNVVGYYCQTIDNGIFVPARILNLGGSGTPDTMSSTGIEQISEIGIKVFPIPSSGLLHITNESNSIERVELLTMQGIKLQEYLIKTHDAELDLKDVKNGIYFIRIYSKSGDVINRKIIRME